MPKARKLHMESGDYFPTKMVGWRFLMRLASDFFEPTLFVGYMIGLAGGMSLGLSEVTSGSTVAPATAFLAVMILGALQRRREIKFAIPSGMVAVFKEELCRLLPLDGYTPVAPTWWEKIRRLLGAAEIRAFRKPGLPPKTFVYRWVKMSDRPVAVRKVDDYGGYVQWRDRQGNIILIERKGG